ncbi:MAG: GAF domain-containing protein [Armatimonadia bacterium]
MEEVALRVLVVDDQPDHREVVRDALVHHYQNIQVAEAELASEALAALNAAAYDAVLLDYMLPDRTAIEALPDLTAAAPETVFIVMTAHGDEEIAASSIRRGAADYVVKGKNLVQRLFIALDSALKAERLRREAREAKARIEHLNSVLLAIRNVSQLIAQEPDRDRLLQSICERLTVTRGYGAAWIVLLDSAGNFTQAYESGLGESFSLVIEALQKQDFPACLRSVLEHPEQVAAVPSNAWHGACPMHRLHGDTGILGTGLCYADTIYGALFVSVPDELLHAEEEQGLFHDLAADISLALHSQEVEAQRLATEDDLRELNRIWAVLTRINEMIVRVRDRDRLFQDTCRIAVDEGGFLMAWIGLLNEQTLQIVPVAFWGQEDGYLTVIRISADDVPEGRGPTGRALRLNRHQICDDIEQDGSMLPWVAEARKRGYRSSASFPLEAGGRAIGAIVLYSDRPHFFNQRRVALLLTLAADLSYALQVVEQEEQRQQALAALQHSEETFRQLIESAPLGIVIRRGLDLVYVNPKLLELLGYDSQDEVPDQNVLSLYAPETRRVVRDNVLARDRGEDAPIRYDVNVVTRDGQVRTHQLNVAKITLADGPAALGFHTDISDRIAMEEDLRREIEEREQAQQRLLVQQGELRALATEISLAEERERRRVATQLHDTVVQFLAFAKLKLGLLQQKTIGEGSEQTLAEVEDLLQEALSRSRAVMYELSSSALYEIGFEEAVKTLVHQYQDQYSLPVEFHDDGQPKPLGMDLQIVLFQSLRELLVNVLDRDNVTEAQVSLSRRGDQVALVVKDNGEPRPPLKPASDEERRRMGMLSIRERLRYFGGQLLTETAPGQGTTATLLAPVEMAEG